MFWCAERGVPHSELLGRAAAPGEPRWLPEDRAKLAAAQLERAEICPRCGTAPWQWDEDRFAYESVVKHCQGCYVLAVSREGHDQSRDLPGQSHELAPKAVAARMRHDAARRRPPRRRRRNK